MIETIDVVEAAILPELFYSVAVSSLKDDDAKIIIEKLRDDVLLYRSVLPEHAKGTFDRHLDKTATKITDTFYNAQTKQWDGVAMFSTFLELASHLSEKGDLKITDGFAHCVRVISEKMHEQHYETWEGMMIVAKKRANRVLTILQSRGYFK